MCKYKQMIKTTNQNKRKKHGEPMRTQRRSDRTTSKKARENTNSEVAVDSTFAFLGLIDWHKFRNLTQSTLEKNPHTISNHLRHSTVTTFISLSDFFFKVSSVTWSCSSLTRMRCWIHGLFFSCQNCCYCTDNHLCTKQTNKQTQKQNRNKIKHWCKL